MEPGVGVDHEHDVDEAGPGRVLALAAQLLPDLAHAVDVEVLREDTPDLDLADRILLRPRR